MRVSWYLVPAELNPPPPPAPSRREKLKRAAVEAYPTVRYWMQTEVHVYAFSIAANILLAFFPFLIVMVSLCEHVLHWRAATEAVYFAVADFFPSQIGSFIESNLRATAASHGPVQIVSILVLLLTANGIFVPLEVALNRIWGCAENRSYLRNQFVSAGLIFACGALAMISTTLTALNNDTLRLVSGDNSIVQTVVGGVLFKLAAVPLSIFALFLIYWFLPNCRISPRQILPAAVVAGILLEVLKYVNLLAWVWMRSKLESEYGPFQYSVALVLSGFLAAMLILAGAEWASRKTPPQFVNKAIPGAAQ